MSATKRRAYLGILLLVIRLISPFLPFATAALVEDRLLKMKRRFFLVFFSFFPFAVPVSSPAETETLSSAPVARVDCMLALRD